MKNYMIVKGMVIGGHKIPDLGLNVPYGQEVPIPSDRATWSRDLSESIRTGNVEKVGVRATPQRTPPVPARTRTAPPISSAPVPVEPAVSVPNKATPEPSEPTSSENTEELRRMNRELMEKIERMTEGQEALLRKMGEILDRPPAPALDPKALQGLLRPRTDSVGTSDDPYGAAEEEEVIFIPSKIRSEKTKVSDVEVREETRSAGSNLDAAQDALAALGKKRRRKRKKVDEDE